MQPINTESSDAASLQAAAKKALQDRLFAHANYRLAELGEISKLDRRLFPGNFELSQRDTDMFRALTALSQIGLKQTQHITSHRRYVGPIIVGFKRLLLPFLGVYLRPVFDSLQEFASWVVYLLADHHVKLSKVQARD